MNEFLKNYISTIFLGKLLPNPDWLNRKILTIQLCLIYKWKLLLKIGY